MLVFTLDVLHNYPLVPQRFSSLLTLAKLRRLLTVNALIICNSSKVI